MASRSILVLNTLKNGSNKFLLNKSMNKLNYLNGIAAMSTKIRSMSLSRDQSAAFLTSFNSIKSNRSSIHLSRVFHSNILFKYKKKF